MNKPVASKRDKVLTRLVAKISDQDKRKTDKKNLKDSSLASKYGKKSYFLSYLRRKKNNVIIWCAGIFKEFSRISWLKGSALGRSFLIVVIILIIGAGLFYFVNLLAGWIN